MKLSIKKEHTRYAVSFMLKKDYTVTIGKLDTHHFLKGKYLCGERQEKYSCTSESPYKD